MRIILRGHRAVRFCGFELELIFPSLSRVIPHFILERFLNWDTINLLGGISMRQFIIVFILAFILVLSGCQSQNDLTEITNQINENKATLQANTNKMIQLDALLKEMKEKVNSYIPTFLERGSAFCCDTGIEYYDEAKDVMILTPALTNIRIEFKGKLPVQITMNEQRGLVHFYFNGEFGSDGNITKEFILGYEAVSKLALERAGIKDIVLDLGNGMALVRVNGEPSKLTGSSLKIREDFEKLVFTITLGK